MYFRIEDLFGFGPKEFGGSNSLQKQIRIKCQFQFLERIRIKEPTTSFGSLGGKKDEKIKRATSFG
jgi:hypothetical protein